MVGSDCQTVALFTIFIVLFFSSVANFSSATSCVDRPSTLFKRGDLSPAAAEGGDQSDQLGSGGGREGPPEVLDGHTPPQPPCTLTFSQRYEVTSEEEHSIIFIVILLLLPSLSQR